MGRIKNIVTTVLIFFSMGVYSMYAEQKPSYKEIAVMEEKIKGLDLSISVITMEKEIDIIGKLTNNTKEDIFVPSYYIDFNDDGFLNRDCFYIKKTNGKKIENKIDFDCKIDFQYIWKNGITIKSGDEISFCAKNIQNSYALENAESFMVILNICGLQSNAVVIQGY